MKSGYAIMHSYGDRPYQLKGKGMTDVADGQARGTSRIRSIRSFIGLSSFAGLLLFFASGALRIAPLVGEDTDLWVLFAATICGALCCSLGFTLRGALSSSVVYHHGGIKAMLAGLGGLMCCFAHVCFGAGEVLGVLGGFFLGIGLSLTGVGWGMTLCGLENRRLLRSILLVGLAGGTINALMLLLPDLFLVLGLSLLLFASLLLPSHISERSSLPEEDERGRRKVLELARDMAKRNWVLFFSLVLLSI
jgi:hypothetical protein